MQGGSCSSLPAFLKLQGRSMSSQALTCWNQKEDSSFYFCHLPHQPDLVNRVREPARETYLATTSTRIRVSAILTCNQRIVQVPPQIDAEPSYLRLCCDLSVPADDGGEPPSQTAISVRHGVGKGIEFNSRVISRSANGVEHLHLHNAPLTREI